MMGVQAKELNSFFAFPKHHMHYPLNNNKSEKNECATTETDN